MSGSSQRVAVVAGGGAGIGAATAVELARTGCEVVILDPGVSVEGRAGEETPQDATVERINASGGRASLKRVSVTDGPAVAAAVGEVLDSHGRLDAVVNAAGFDRRADYLEGTGQDWADVLDVHLGGHLTLLTHTVPALAASGGGRFVGFTSGAGWRAGHGNAYGCAKRAICSLTWSLADRLPDGVTFNVISPIANTRMTRAHARDPAAGLNPASFPPAEHIAPLAAHLAAADSACYRGQVLFTDGSEVARVGAPRLVEAVSFDGSAASFDAIVPEILAPAQARQRSGGGAAARQWTMAVPRSAGSPADDRCAVVIGKGWHGLPVGEVVSLLAGQGLRAVLVDGDLDAVPASGVFAAAASRLSAAEAATPTSRALLLTGQAEALDPAWDAEWDRLAAAFGTVTTRVLQHAAWVRAFVRRAQAHGGVRVVSAQAGATACDAATAQACAQLLRGVTRREAGAIVTCSLTVRGGERSWRTAVQFAGHLAGAPDVASLAGAELIAGDAWVGISAHPQPEAAATYAGPGVPPWLDDVLTDRTDLK